MLVSQPRAQITNPCHFSATNTPPFLTLLIIGPWKDIGTDIEECIHPK
jgi:hypothetical protein